MEADGSGEAGALTTTTTTGAAAAEAVMGGEVVLAAPDDVMEKEEEEEEPWQHACGAVLTIQNVVATVNLCVTIDLRHLALSARNAEYNPQKFAAVIMRVREPRCTALIFSTGKMVVTGAKSEFAARRGARKFAAIVRKIGFAPRFTEFKIQNMVATADAGFPIRLEGLVYAHAKFASYEPELFPGLIYRLVSPKLVLLLFVSGRLVITGAKTVENLRTAFEKMYPVLCDFKKETNPHDRRQRPRRPAQQRPTVDDPQVPLALPPPPPELADLPADELGAASEETPPIPAAASQ